MTVRLSPLGRPHYRVDNDRRRRPLRSASGELLLLLALDRRTTRNELLTTLWPDLPRSKAEANLDRALTELRGELGDAWLLVEGDTLVATEELQLDEGNLPGDAPERRHTPQRDALLDTIRTLPDRREDRPEEQPGPWEEGRTLPAHSRPRNPWVTLLVELRRRHVLHVAAVYLVGAWAAIESSSTIAPMSRLPEWSPQVVLALAIAGFPIALVLAWAFDLTLEGYRRAQPTPANLFRALWSNPEARRWTLVAAAAVPLFVIGAWLLVVPPAEGGEGAQESAFEPPEPSRIAVLYFRATEADPQLRGIATGLTLALIHELDLVPALKVTPSNGVLPYRDSPVSGDSIARALNVATLVDGALMRLGDSLRLSVELSAVGERGLLDSWAVTAPTTFELINEVIDRIARSLRQSLGRQVHVRQWHSGTNDQRAWDLMQTAVNLEDDAKDLNDDGDPEAAVRKLLRADSMLVDVSGRDPRWPDPVLERGRVARGLFFVSLRLGDLATMWAWMDSADARATSVLSEDPENAAALELRGQILQEKAMFRPPPTQAERDSLVSAAEHALRQAVDLDGGRALAWAALSRILFGRGAFAEARWASEKAYAADAYLEESQQILDRLFQTSFELRQDSAADSWCAEQKRRFPDDWVSARCRLMLMTCSPRSTPDPAVAWALLDSLPPTAAEDPAMPNLQLLVAGVLIRAGLADSAHAVIDRVTSAPPKSAERLHYEAATRLLLGERHAALELLRQYVQSVPGGANVLLSRRFDELRGDPGFDSLRVSSVVRDR